MVKPSYYFFNYGCKVFVKHNRSLKDCVFKICPTNPCFLECFPKNSGKSIRNVFLYHVQSLTRQQTSTYEGKIKLTIRFRSPKDNFSVYFESEEENNEFRDHLLALVEYLRERPYGEFQLKNLIRYSLNIAKINKTNNIYSLGRVSF